MKKSTGSNEGARRGSDGGAKPKKGSDGPTHSQGSDTHIPSVEEKVRDISLHHTPHLHHSVSRGTKYEDDNIEDCNSSDHIQASALSLSDIQTSAQAQVSLISLPDDVLFLILSYIQPKDLCNICCVCRRLYLLSSKDSVWMQHARRTAVVKFSYTSRQYSVKELCMVAPKWKSGRFKEFFVVKHRTRHLPWVNKSDEGLWFSTGNRIRYFHFHPSGYLKEETDKCLIGMEDDATRFLQKNDMVVSGCRNGGVYGWDSSGKPIFCYKQVHSSDVQCVDFTDSVIVTGSRDSTCKILPLEAPPDNADLDVRSFDVGERVWSLRISPCERFFAAGLAGCLDDPPVIMWDMESGKCLGQLAMNHRRGAGVSDLKFESPNELLTCGYDTFVRKWDLRSQKCVAQWEEPYDSALYCIESDGHNTFLVGTARHGMVRLWDRRKTEPVQAYYCNRQHSPVYSLAIDYGHLYLALDMGLYIMDFTASPAQVTASNTSTQHSASTSRGKPRHTFRR